METLRVRAEHRHFPHSAGEGVDHSQDDQDQKRERTYHPDDLAKHRDNIADPQCQPGDEKRESLLTVMLGKRTFSF